MNESGKFEVYKKKLDGLCEEHHLVYRFRKDRYPITLTFQPTGDTSGQMSLLEPTEEDGYRSPDATLMFAFKDGALVYRISETFTISDALFNKLKNLFKNMHSAWLQYFFRDIIEHKTLTSEQMPVIGERDDSEDDGESDFDDFDEMRDALESLETFNVDNEEETSNVDAADQGEDPGEEGDDYEYDKPDCQPEA